MPNFLSKIGSGLKDVLTGKANEDFRERERDRLRPELDIPGFDRRDQQTQDALGKFGNFQNPDLGGPSQFRGNQEELMDLFRRRASGADSQSRRDLRDSTDRARKFALSQNAAGAGGLGGALNARQASQGLGSLESGLRGQQASAGIAERGASGQIAAGIAGQARGQDLSRLGLDINSQLASEGLRQSGTFGALDRDLANARARQEGRFGVEQFTNGKQDPRVEMLGKLFNAGATLGGMG